jgi:hypothetical protein
MTRRARTRCRGCTGSPPTSSAGTAEPRSGCTGLAAAAIAALVVAAPHSPASHPASGQPPATLPTVRELAYRASTAALAATPVSPSHISYAELAKLPSGPPALARYIYRREQQILGPEPANLNWQMTFDAVAGFFTYYVLPPKVAATLFQALPYIPGVQVVKETGSIAFIRSYGNLETEKVILNPSTYAVTGLVLADRSARFQAQTTFSPWVPVSGPGVRP